MNDLQKYIAKREKTDKDFAENYDEGYEVFKTGKSFDERAEDGDWGKVREILAKVYGVEAEDFDKL